MTDKVLNADRCPTCGLVSERSNRPATWTLFGDREREAVGISFRIGDRVCVHEFTLKQATHLAEQMAAVVARCDAGDYGDGLSYGDKP